MKKASKFSRTHKRDKRYIYLYLNQKQYRYLEEQSAYQHKFMTDIVIDMIEQARLNDDFERGVRTISGFYDEEVNADETYS